MPMLRSRIGVVGAACSLILWAVVSAAQESPASPKKASPADESKRKSPDVRTAPIPDPDEIIKELEKEKPESPIVLPKDPRGVIKSTRRRVPAVTPSQQDAANLPDGYVLVDRAGRLTRDGEWLAYSFRSDENRTVRDQPMRLLPSRWLENMEIAASRGSKNMLFKVSGEVTEYRGVNYLLLRKVLVVREHGNLQ